MCHLTRFLSINPAIVRVVYYESAVLWRVRVLLPLLIRFGDLAVELIGELLRVWTLEGEGQCRKSLLHLEDCSTDCSILLPAPGGAMRQTKRSCPLAVRGERRRNVCQSLFPGGMMVTTGSRDSFFLFSSFKKNWFFPSY